MKRETPQQLRLCGEGPPIPGCDHPTTGHTSSRWWCSTCGEELSFGQTSFIRRLKAYYAEKREAG